MASISIQNVRINIGGKPIVEHVTFSLSPGDRIALVGPNGMGKTTFLRVLTGEVEPDDGTIERSDHVSILRLEQWRKTEQTRLYDVAFEANPTLLTLDQELKSIESKMADPALGEFLDDLVTRWGLLSEKFQAMGGYDWESQVKAGLQKMGFPPERWDDSPDNLSGGEAHRLALLAMILSGTSVWLLDEPTNHLDIHTIAWLEDMIKASSAAMVIVSHDRAFLNRVATRTMSWEDGSFWIATGNWTQYQHLRDERMRHEALQWQRQQEEERRLRSYIDRWRSGTRARQAQSRQKRLDRLTQKPAPTAPPISNRPLTLTHQGQERLGHLPALRLERLQVQRGTRLWEPIQLAIPLNARVALVGANGTGKTSLLEAMITAPESHWNPDVTPAYLPQTAVQELPDGVLGMDYAFELGWDREQIYYLGARFGISELLWMQPLETWSGGERARLKLLETLMTPSQALLLDEPTNHLDVRMREALERLLIEYPGTLVIASHDRAFLEQVSTHTWWSLGESFVFERMPYRTDRQAPTPTN